MEHNLIIGIHAIQAALRNPERKHVEIVMTEEGQKALAHDLAGKSNLQKSVLSKHDFQEKSKQLYGQRGLEYHRIGGGALLLCSALEVKTPDFLYRMCQSQKKLKVVILDGVTDIHNAGAIIRTAHFYGVDIVVMGGKSSFAMTPAFFRIASGGVEFLTIVEGGNLPRAVNKIQQLGVTAFALSQHAKQQKIPEEIPSQVAIILGAEGRGVSHALLRQCERTLALQGGGKTPSSLNVSVAAAIAMERLFQTI